MHQVLKQFVLNWQRTFLTGFLLDLVFILAIAVGAKYYGRQKEKAYFLIYFVVGGILFIGLDVVEAFKLVQDMRLRIIFELGNTLFEIAEFLAFYFLFKRLLKKPSFIKVANVFMTILVITSVVFIARLFVPDYDSVVFQRHSLYINVVELFFLAVLCLFYFFDLLTDVPTIDLFKRPSFFIVTTAFFYAVLTIPFFVIAHDMRLLQEWLYNILISCHYILLMLMLAAILNTFLCNKAITT